VEVVGLVLPGGSSESTAREVLTCHAGVPGDATLASAIQWVDPEMVCPKIFIFSKCRYWSQVQLAKCSPYSWVLQSRVARVVGNKEPWAA